MTVEPGALYKHYKNKNYKVVGVACHSETLEEYVVYQALYETPGFEPNQLWIRPKAMFLEEVEVNGVKQPRFQRLNQQDESVQ